MSDRDVVIRVEEREMKFEAFANLAFPSGHFISEIVGVGEKMLDPIGRPALARAIIEGKRITIQISSDLDEREDGISIYHEVLESLAVALDEPPESVMELNLDSKNLPKRLI